MKALIILTVLFSVSSHANSGMIDGSVYCKRTSKTSCEARVLSAYKKLGCAPVSDSIKCAEGDRNGYDDCDIQSQCRQANVELFGKAYCMSGEEVNLKSVDRNITGTTTSGLFQKHLTLLCKNN